ncbi:uncharacterized protein [Ptychodera flava]|uniref:uncharacterized protein n=1 Tax=Ptychodera flava TaxID=63121 RepID=UPI00396A7328
MARPTRECNISSLNVLFKELERAMDSNDVREVKNLLRGEQVSEEDMEKISKATDVFYHLLKHGYIGECNLVLLKNLFQQIGREPLQGKVAEFQRTHNSSISRRSTKIMWPVERVKSKLHMHRKSPYRLKAKANFVIEETRKKKRNRTENEDTDQRTRDLEKLRIEVKKQRLEVEAQELEFRKQEIELKKLQRKTQITQVEIESEKQYMKLDAVKCLRQYINDVCKRITEEKDPALIQQLTESFEQCKATLEKIGSGSLIFWLSFLSEHDVQSFWQVYKDGKVDDTLTALFVTSELRALAEAACCTVRVTLEIDEGEYMELKEKVHEMASLETWWRKRYYDKWEIYVKNHVQDAERVNHLIELSTSDPVMHMLRQEDFFFPSIISFYFKNSYTLPETVTKATEYAVMHNAEMYCEENNVEVDNLREILRARLYEIGECLNENITIENVGKLYPSWLDQKKIPNVERHLFGLLTKSGNCYCFQSKYVYSYIIALYLSGIIALSPNNIPLLIREERTKIWEVNLPYCFPYITGILGDKASYFLKEVALFSSVRSSVDIDSVGLIGNCVFESECPASYAKDIEEVLGYENTLDLSSCTWISNQSIHALSVVLQNTKLIKDIQLYAESEESSLSSEFKKCLENIMEDPLTDDSCEIRIHTSFDLSVAAKLLRILPLLCKKSQSRFGDGTTQQPNLTSLAIEGDVNLTEIDKGTIETFIEALSHMNDLEKLRITGLGERFCEQFLHCLFEEAVSLNINTLCLVGNELTWKHCSLLSEILPSMPHLRVLDLDRNGIGSLGCSVLLPIKDEIHVRVAGNQIAQGLPEILPLCTGRAERQHFGFQEIESLKDVASLIRSLENVSHINCTKISGSKLETMCQNVSLLTDLKAIDLSGTVLDENAVMLLCDSMKYLKKLEKVDLSHCSISRCEMKALLESISPEVTDLNLSHANILNDSSSFSNMSKPTPVLSDATTWPFLPETLKRFRNMRHLDISGNKIDHQGVAALGNCLLLLEKLEDVNLSNTNIGMTEVKVLHKIQKQHISRPFINVAHNLPYLSSIFPYIRNQLHRSCSETIDFDSDELFVHSLTGVMEIAEVTVRNERWTDKDFKGFIEGLNYLNLKFLDLCRNNMGDVCAKSLSERMRSFSELTFLDLSHNNIGDKGVESLSKVTGSMLRLSHLDLSHNKIGYRGAKSLAEGMGSMGGLTHLDLSHNNIEDTGTESLSERLWLIHGLRYLDLSHNNIGDKGAEVLGEVMSLMHELTHLDLSHNKIGDSGIESLSEGLSFLDELGCLDLSHNNIEDRGAMSLGEGIRYMIGLHHLDLSHNKIGDRGATSLSDRAWLLQRLTHLDLSYNKIGDSGAETLSDVETLVSRLVHLDLSHNNLRDRGAKCLSEKMALMLRLTYLDLSHNNIGWSGAERLCEGMMKIPELTHLNFSNNNLKSGQRGAEILAEVLKQEYELSHIDLVT